MNEITVMLDPTFVVINSAHPNEQHINTQIMNIGVKSTNDISRVLVTFPIDAIPQDAVITKASLKLYITTTSDKQNNIIKPYMITSPWSPESVTWNFQPKYNPNIYGTPVNIQYSGFVFFDITNLVSQWHKQHQPFNGFILKNDEVKSNCYATMLYTQSKYEKPFIQIQYVLRCNCCATCTKFVEKTEVLQAEDTFAYTSTLDVSLTKTIACFIKNTGNSSIFAKFQYSPNSIDFENGIETKEILPGELLHTFPYLFSKYLRLGVKTSCEDEKSKAVIWFQLQV